MIVERHINQKITDIAQQCGLDELPNAHVIQEESFGCGYNEESGYFFINCSRERYEKSQDAFGHEAAHLVRLFLEKEQDIGLRQELDRVSKLVDIDIEQGILGKNVINLYFLMFSKGASEELVACYFGVNRDKKEALQGANELKSQETLEIMKQHLNEWKKHIYTITGETEKTEIDNQEIIDIHRIFQILSDLGDVRAMGKYHGAILGNWLVGEKVAPKEIMFHNPFGLFEVLEDLVNLDNFPEDLAGFVREKGLFENENNQVGKLFEV